MLCRDACARDRLLFKRCKRSQLFTKIYLISPNTRFGWSDSPTSWLMHRHAHTESIHVRYRPCTAEAVRRVAAACAGYRRSAERAIHPQRRTVAPARHPGAHAAHFDGLAGVIVRAPHVEALSTRVAHVLRKAATRSRATREAGAVVAAAVAAPRATRRVGDAVGMECRVPASVHHVLPKLRQLQPAQL